MKMKYSTPRVYIEQIQAEAIICTSPSLRKDDATDDTGIEGFEGAGLGKDRNEYQW